MISVRNVTTLARTIIVFACPLDSSSNSFASGYIVQLGVGGEDRWRVEGLRGSLSLNLLSSHELLNAQS